MARHKHADVMIAYANDPSIKIQVSGPHTPSLPHVDPALIKWEDLTHQPSFKEHFEYRIKPPEPVVVTAYGVADLLVGDRAIVTLLTTKDYSPTKCNIKLTFTDGIFTGAEVI